MMGGKPSSSARALAKWAEEPSSPITIRILAGGGDVLTEDGSLAAERTYTVRYGRDGADSARQYFRNTTPETPVPPRRRMCCGSIAARAQSPCMEKTATTGSMPLEIAVNDTRTASSARRMGRQEIIPGGFIAGWFLIGQSSPPCLVTSG